jgi:hypothetical protein
MSIEGEMNEASWGEKINIHRCARFSAENVFVLTGEKAKISLESTKMDTNKRTKPKGLKKTTTGAGMLTAHQLGTETLHYISNTMTASKKLHLEVYVLQERRLRSHPLRAAPETFGTMLVYQTDARCTNSLIRYWKRNSLTQEGRRLWRRRRGRS